MKHSDKRNAHASHIAGLSKGREFGVHLREFGRVSGGRAGRGERLAALRAHIEARFTDGMTWEHYLNGDVVIDHIQSASLFDLSKGYEARYYWALSNLQPLWAADNIRKGNTKDKNDKHLLQQWLQG
jgi:hypothetical protein